MTSSPWKEECLGPESRKAHPRRVREGFFDRYFGGVVLDIGYRGYEDQEVVPVLEDAIGIDLNYPGYDGKRLPFEDGTVDTVYASHTLEHIDDPLEAIREWFRVLKVGGYLVLGVPHQFLYEKRALRPSRWNDDHKRFYTPSSLLGEVEAALPPNSYRVRRLMDDDENYDYAIPPSRHAGGAYQIELVLEKIPQPAWSLEVPGQPVPDPGAPAAARLEDLNARLEVVFTDLRNAAQGLLAEQRQMASRLQAISAHLGRAARALQAGAGPAPAGPITGDLRQDAVPLPDSLTTTKFFGNRIQLRTLLGELRGRREGGLHILVAGASRGCEVYSLAIEGELAGMDLRITGLDIDPGNIAFAVEGKYPLADFKDFDGTPLLDEATASYFVQEDGQIKVDLGAFRRVPQFIAGDLFTHEGFYDAIVCNNVLVHFSDRAAAAALDRLLGQLFADGILAVGGAPMEVIARSLGGRSGLAPIETGLEPIWEAWKGDRQSWTGDPGRHVGTPPLDRSLPDWKVRFCTLFRKLEEGGATPVDSAFLGNARQAVGAMAESGSLLAQSLGTVVEYLDDLLKA